MKRLNVMKYGAFALLSLSASCIGEDSTEQDPAFPSRTVLIYMAADNSLVEETAQKIEALRRGWQWRGNKCLVYVDTPDGARLLRLRGGCQMAPTPYVETIAEYGPENSASAAVFGRVIRDVTAVYPSESYGLIFFSHASGWLPAGALQDPGHTMSGATGIPATLAVPGTRSICWDNGEEKPEGIRHAEMELEEFAAAIPDGTLDFIIFESCLMAGVEVAYALRDKTDYIMASSAEIVSPGFTPVYSSALSFLFDTSLSLEESLAAFGTAYMCHVSKLRGDYRSATLSLVDTKELDLLAARTQDLLSGLSHQGDIIPGLQHFDRPGSYGDTLAVARYFDLGEWARRIGTQKQYTLFEEQLKRTVRWKASTEYFLPAQNGFRIKNHSGLTIYVERPELSILNAYYNTTAWYTAVHKK